MHKNRTTASIRFWLHCGSRIEKVRRGVVPGGVGGALADPLTLTQPGGIDYAHLITTDTPGFSDLPTALVRDLLDLSLLLIFDTPDSFCDCLLSKVPTLWKLKF